MIAFTYAEAQTDKESECVVVHHKSISTIHNIVARNIWLKNLKTAHWLRVRERVDARKRVYCGYYVLADLFVHGVVYCMVWCIYDLNVWINE